MFFDGIFAEYFREVMLKIIIIYLLVVNVAALVYYGVDKYKSRKGMWRTPESRLLCIALIGGALGALLGMYIFRHKTQHTRFKYGVPFMLLAQLALLVYVFLGGKNDASNGI